VKVGAAILEPEAKEFYCHTLHVLKQAGIDFLIGGAYAFARYTGIERHTKDCDVFVRYADFEATLRALGREGFRTEVPFTHWLGKAHHGEYFVDVIYGSGNGLACVDEDWFEKATHDHVFDVPVLLVPVEEMIWSKALIQERERFDGADVAHLLLARAEQIDWHRLLQRFGHHWRVLFSHLVLFGYIYPADWQKVPAWVMQVLVRRLEREMRSEVPRERVCRGTLLSRQQYLVDVEGRGYIDARTLPENPMTDAEIATWTAGIARDGTREE
jgi:hypothetical protein